MCGTFDEAAWNRRVMAVRREFHTGAVICLTEGNRRRAKAAIKRLQFDFGLLASDSDFHLYSQMRYLRRPDTNDILVVLLPSQITVVSVS